MPFEIILQHKFSLAFFKPSLVLLTNFGILNFLVANKGPGLSYKGGGGIQLGKHDRWSALGLYIGTIFITSLFKWHCK